MVDSDSTGIGKVVSSSPDAAFSEESVSHGRSRKSVDKHESAAALLVARCVIVSCEQCCLCGTRSITMPSDVLKLRSDQLTVDDSVHIIQDEDIISIRMIGSVKDVGGFLQTP